MHKLEYLSQIIGATAIALLLGATPVHAQTASGSSSNASSGSSGASSNAKVSDDDRQMMEDIAEANYAEIETGKMALDKSKNDQVRKFAQKMIDDHTTALKELQKLAQAKGVKLPTETDVKHKTIATALKALSGDTFDSQYLSRVGVDDHQATVELLQKTQKNAKDSELRAYAGKILPIVEQHLSMAKQMANKK